MPQICNRKTDLNYSQTILSPAKPVFSLSRPYAKMYSCRWETDEKQFCTWSRCEICRVCKTSIKARVRSSIRYNFAGAGPFAALLINSYSYIQFNNNKKRRKMPILSLFCIHFQEAFQKYITNFLIMFVYPAGKFPGNMTEYLPVLHSNITM